MLPPDDWKRQVYRASKLDDFRAYLSGQETYSGDEYTSELFIKRLTAPIEESPAMAAGTAIHGLIERAGFGELPREADVNGWHIVLDLDADIAIPAMREVPLYAEHRGIPLFGRCDAIDANTVHDLKTTSSIDIDRYLDSYQWRAYLYMSGRQNFVYDILRVKVEDDIKVVTVLEYVPVPVSAYPGLSRDVEELLEAYDLCVRALGIPDLMKEAA